MPRNQALDVIANEIVVCTKCRLSKTRQNAVPGEGSASSEIILVGEGPGRSEDIEKRPFVGRAGKFLDKLLCEAGLVREKVFICNVVRCRPPGNREPWLDEIQACAPYLDRQIMVIKPRMIVTLGNCAASYMFSKAGLFFDGITKGHGRSYETMVLDLPMTLFASFHPASALYNTKYKMLLTADFKILKDELKKMKSVESPTRLEPHLPGEGTTRLHG